MLFHTVRAGDTLSSIAREYGATVTDLLLYNGMPNPENLAVGQCVVIVYPELVHRVTSGETLTSIAAAYGTTVNALYRNNPALRAQDALYPDERLVISLSGEPIGSFQTGGYAYVSIPQELLDVTMPYMDYFMPFTYGFTPDGELVALAGDGRLIDAARRYGAEAYMHLSTLTQEGVFSNELASVLLNDGGIQDVLLENVLVTMREKGYDGLDIDFEFVLRDDAYKYAGFVEKARVKMNAAGFPVFTALAPKVRDEQPGLLYEGHLYREIGQAANAVLLMTYEWGYTYGPPQAVSPLPSVRRVLDYAVTRIPREKIFMGMSNYGYDWKLPYVRGQSKAKSLSTDEALLLASQNRAEIRYDETAEAPYFYYTTDGAAHVVWFEDARSIAARLQLIPEYGFRGCLYWNLMRPNTQNLLMLNLLNDRV